MSDRVIITTLTTAVGTITHTGTSGYTITSTRVGNDVNTLIEYSASTADELRESVCVLLCMLDDKEGERFVASCLARYAEETGKKFLDHGDGGKLAMIRGRKP